jgi:hypothetical protein
VTDQRHSLTDAEKAELVEKLSDPVWRICNLYRIVNKRGKEVPFEPTAEQMTLIHAVYVLKQKRHVILKARQLGMSTLIAIMILDACYFGENVMASIVDQTQAHATAKLAKIKFAYEGLGPLRERLTEDNARAIGFANNSAVSAGKNARGTTNQWLHVSEWGPIAHEDPKRSEEIKTGALPTAEHGVIFVESTFKGGKGGHFYELLKASMETPESHRTDKDFVFHFFPWYLDKGYTLEGSADAIPATVRAYFIQKEAELGVTFTDGQKLWYAKTKAEQGIFMFREYPTTVEEALSAPVDGSIYGDILSGLRSRGRIIPFEWERSSPVFSSWDLGWNDSTSVWLWQIVGRDILWIWHTRQKGKTAAEMAHEVQSTGIPVAAHYLPHDAASTTAAVGTSYKGELAKAGLANLIVVPQPQNIWSGINQLRDVLARSMFNLPACKVGIEALEAYHTKDMSSGGTVTKEPVHDWASHDSDGARVAAEALNLGLVTPAVAKRALQQNPRYPDGTMVDHAAVQAVRERGRRQTALSGPRAL